MDPNAPSEVLWVSSKEILEKSGISRATLNNYIRMGLLPRPVVRRPGEKDSSVKKIGYFPGWVLERILLVQRLKKEGMSMEEISEGLQQEDSPGRPSIPERGVFRAADTVPSSARGTVQTHPLSLTLTFEQISVPAYMLSHDYDIVWLNRAAELIPFKDTVNYLEFKQLPNIFKVLFNWELHNQIANWKNLMSLHMAHAKARKTDKSWIGGLYKGITGGEIAILEEIYDRVAASQIQTITHCYLSLLSRDGTSDSFKVTTLFAIQGILYLYMPWDYERL